MKISFLLLFFISFSAQAEFFITDEPTQFKQIVTANKTGSNILFKDLSNFKSGLCFSKNDQDVGVDTVLVSLTQEIQGQIVTKMAFYFVEPGQEPIQEGSAEALELQSYLKDDWRFWSEVKEEGGLHFFYDIENNGRVDGKTKITRSGDRLSLTYQNLIGQKLTFMGKTFRSKKNEIIGACLF